MNIDAEKVKNMLSVKSLGKTKSLNSVDLKKLTLLKALHILCIKMPKFKKSKDLLKNQSSTELRLKQMKKLNIDLLFLAQLESSDFISLYHSALEAYKCCQKENLHLFNLEKIFQENNRLFEKNTIIKWKLPDQFIGDSFIQQHSDNLKSKSRNVKNSHRIMQIINENQKETYDVEQNQIELQNRCKLENNYKRFGSPLRDIK